MCGFAVAALLLGGAAPSAAEPQSPRLDRAKDYIADERWVRAIAELKAAAADPRERSRDEALFWLAHSHNQAGDPAAALETIRRLETEFPRSRWVKPAQSLRIELAHRLNRTDVLWLAAVPPSPAPPPTPAPTVVVPAPAPPTLPERTPRPPQPSRAPLPRPQALVAPAPPAPPTVWVPLDRELDVELRIQALGSLILSDSGEAVKVIPILRDIALEAPSPGQAHRALFALAQCRLPQARSTVVEVARTAPEAVRVEAVRVLGRLRGPDVSSTLLRVYTDAGEPVKYQIVTSFGQRAEAAPLLRIVQSEVNQQLREMAVVTLGRTPGGSFHLRRMYDTASASLKRPIISGLFNARDDEGLIRIARRERQTMLRREIVDKLRLLGTPKAREYLEQADEK